MAKRWVAAGVLKAKRGFRKGRGYKSMPNLVRAPGTIDTVDQERHLARQPTNYDESAASMINTRRNIPLPKAATLCH